MRAVKNIFGLKEIFQNYDTFILDQWGVMHDGYIGYPEAIKCIADLISNNKKIIIISNSSKKKNLLVNVYHHWVLTKINLQK